MGDPVTAIFLILCQTAAVSGMASRLYDFTPAQIQAVLTEHNYLRSLEPATNMQELIWDDHLASIAKDWASRCSAEHRPLWQRQRISQYPVIGENIWWSNERYLRSDMGSVIRDFHSEKRYYTYYTHSCHPGNICGHYIQVVWAHSCAVGCAAAFCPYIRRGRGIRTGNMIVCNYGPGGNVIGVRPYQYGKQCASCPFTCRNGLCPSKCPAFQRQKVAVHPNKPMLNQWKPYKPHSSSWSSKTKLQPPAKSKPLQPTVSQKVAFDVAPWKTISDADLQKLSRKAHVKAQMNELDKNMTDCARWVQNGQCFANPALMALMCPKECRMQTNRRVKPYPTPQTSNISPAGECVDKNSMCRAWAKGNHCNINPRYMLKWCPESCRNPFCFTA